MGGASELAPAIGCPARPACSGLMEVGGEDMALATGSVAGGACSTGCLCVSVKVLQGKAAIGHGVMQQSSAAAAPVAGRRQLCVRPDGQACCAMGKGSCWTAGAHKQTGHLGHTSSGRGCALQGREVVTLLAVLGSASALEAAMVVVVGGTALSSGPFFLRIAHSWSARGSLTRCSPEDDASPVAAAGCAVGVSCTRTGQQ